MTKLVLDGNKGLTLTATTFKTPLPQLKTLSLDRCDLTDLDRNVFEGLPNLEELSIIGNHFTAIPLAVKANPGLKAIEMSETDLVELSGYEFSKMKALEKVYMRKMPYLARVSDCAFCRLDKLELVDLSRSKKVHSQFPPNHSLLIQHTLTSSSLFSSPQSTPTRSEACRTRSPCPTHSTPSCWTSARSPHSTRASSTGTT